MEGVVERQIEVHCSGGTAGAVAPSGLHSPPGQALQGLRRHHRQPLGGSAAQPAAAADQEVLLVDALVGAAALEPRRSVGREQEQGDGAEIGLHGRGQQVGDSRARGGDHRRGPA